MGAAQRAALPPREDVLVPVVVLEDSATILLLARVDLHLAAWCQVVRCDRRACLAMRRGGGEINVRRLFDQ